MKSYADKNRTDRVLNEGYMVYLKLQPYGQASVAIRKNLKLSAKYYGRYRILEKIGTMTYRLELPVGVLDPPCLSCLAGAEEGWS